MQFEIDNIWINGQQCDTSEPTVFGSVVQWLDGTITGNEFIDKSGNGYNVDIINNDITVKGLPYKSKALIAQKIANYGLIPDPNNFWFTAGVPNQIPVTCLFQNVDYLNQTFCRHSSRILNAAGIEVSEPKVVEIVTYASALTSTNLVAANSYFDVPAIDTNGKWINPVNGNDTTGNGTQALPYKLHSKVNSLTLAEGTLVYVMTGTIVPVAWQKNYQLKTIGFTKIVSSSPARGIDYDPAGTLNQELSGYFIDMNNVANGVGINCNSPNHPLTLKKFTIKNSVVAAIQSSTYSTQDLNIEECIIDNSNFYGIYANKTLNISDSVINSSSYCIYKDSTSSTDITLTNSKIKHASTPLRLYNLVNFKMIGGSLEWGSYALVSSNSASAGERIFNNVNIKYTGITTGGYFVTENLNITKLEIKDCILECPNMQGAISVLDVNGDFNFINNIAYKEDNSGFNIAVFQKNFSNRTTNVNISGSVVRSDNPFNSALLTIGQDPHPNPNKITGVVEGNNFIHLNDITAHGFIVLYENAGITVQHNRIEGLPVNGFKAHGDSYINNIWKYMLHINAPLLAKSIDYGIYYNNTIVLNQYMPYSASLISCVNNAIPGPTADATNCEFKNHLIVYTGDGGQMNMVKLDHPNNQFDYNIYYNKHYPCVFLYLGVPKTFAQWQALGYDTNSVVLTDAQYEAMFTDPDNLDFSIKEDFVWPINGANTGHATGLDRSTYWGSCKATTKKILKQQPTNYNIGAYIQ